ncbi:MAG TPA: CRISPR-associated endonuclease Cas1 [Candidatus Brocadiia bacterium]|nr:CRISPR-associated endonuclease Cas1 [Candidatus Brocadiales bacterium]
MATLYLTEQGSVLRKTSKRLTVEKEGEVLLEVPEFKVERVLIFGNVQISTQAMAFLLDSGIETAFLSIYGRFRGRLTPMESKNIFLRIKQYEKYLDNAFRLAHSKDIVRAKLQNARTLLMRYSRNHPEVELEESKKHIEECLDKINHKETINSLMGVEGTASSVYFRAFGQLFRRELKFEGRERRPARDPINSLLSFGYTLVTNELISLTCALGFDPYIGYLHGLEYGRPSLALDLIEEFRHPIIDRFTLYLINNQILKEQDFEDKAEEGVLLLDNARKTYFLQYEKYMAREIESNISDTKKTYRELFKLQVHQFMDTIQNDSNYKPYFMSD